MSNDWIEHTGGPQPVDDDVWVGIVTPPCLNWWDIETTPAKEVGWGQKFEWSILNQHLIDAALKRGIELGLEAAEKYNRRAFDLIVDALRNTNPDTIAKEADNEPR